MDIINNKAGIQYLFAISGKARAGKNTVASLMIKHLGYPEDKTKIVALADPMKRIVKSMFPEASEECLYGPSELRSTIIADKYFDKNGKSLTYRQALIDLGAFGRQYNGDIWLNCLVEDARSSTDKWAYIVSDVRFINEFKFLKEAGFTMIRVLRDDAARIDDISETQQEIIPNTDFHYVIDNNSSLNDLSESVRCTILRNTGMI